MLDTDSSPKFDATVPSPGAGLPGLIAACLGTNVGVATAVPAFPGFPLMATSGTYSSVVFDLTMTTIYNPAFITLQGGLAVNVI